MANVQKPPIEIGTKTKIHLAVTALIIAGLIIPAVFLGLFSAQLATAVFQMAGKSTTASTKRAVDYKPSSPLSSLLASAVSNFKQKGTSPSYAYYTQTDLNSSLSKLSSQLRTKISRLSSQEKAKISTEMENIKRAVKSKKAPWTANYNSVFIRSNQQRQSLTGLVIPKGQKLLIQQSAATKSTVPFSATGGGDLPTTFDWRNAQGQNYVTPIRDQASCGSCWAFATVGAMESKINAYFNNPSLAPNLAEQDLVSCNFDDNSGCGGGWMPYAIEYIINNRIADEAHFPYMAVDPDGCDGGCGYPPVLCSAKLPGWESTSWGLDSYDPWVLRDIDIIKQTIMEKGPIVTGMWVFDDFLAYTGGIYSVTSNNWLGGHAVLIVGWGEYDGLTYWIVKNSWGMDWGENGYFRIFAGQSGIDSMLLNSINTPLPVNPIARICTDQDQDGYCNWGLGPKPATGCPLCSNDIMDCNDTDPTKFENCDTYSPVGYLALTTNTTGVDIYVTSLENPNVEIWHGEVPGTIQLNPGQRTIRLERYGYQDYSTTVNIIEGQTTNLDVQLIPDFNVEGWPINLLFYIDMFFESPVIVDLDHDGENEIVVSSGSEELFYTYIYIFDSQGRLKPGWPVKVRPISFSHLAVGDVIGDSNLEIIYWGGVPFPMYSKGKLYVFDKDGNPVYGWPKEFDPPLGLSVSSPLLANIAGDNKKEIILKTDDPGKIYAFYGNGNPVAGWPVVTGDGFKAIFYSPAAADFDDDGYDEIVNFNNSDPQVSAYDQNGTNMPGWPITDNDLDWNPENIYPLIADLNNDGSKELVLANSIYLGTGKKMYNFPAEVLYSVHSKYIAANIDSDSGIETVFLSRVGCEVIYSPDFGAHLYIYKNDGSLKYDIRDGADCNYFAGLVAADVDNDGINELLTVASRYFIDDFGNKTSEHHLLIVNGDTGITKSIPIESANYWFLVSPSSLTVGKLGDKNIAIFIITDNWSDERKTEIRKVELGQVPSAQWPTFMHDAQRTANLPDQTCGSVLVKECTDPAKLVACRTEYEQKNATLSDFLACTQVFNQYVEANGGCGNLYGSYCICGPVVGIECTTQAKVDQCYQAYQQKQATMTQMLGCHQVFNESQK